MIALIFAAMIFGASLALATRKFGEKIPEEPFYPISDKQKWPYVVALEKSLAESRRNEKDLRDELFALRKKIQS